MTSRAVGRILLGWMQALEAWVSRGVRGYISLGNFDKLSCWSPLFLHSERHFNPPSQIKWAFAAREGVRTHAPIAPPCLRPWVAHRPLSVSLLPLPTKKSKNVTCLSGKWLIKSEAMCFWHNLLTQQENKLVLGCQARLSLLCCLFLELITLSEGILHFQNGLS